MKKLLLVSAFVLGISAVSFAQGGGNGGGRRGGDPAQQVERLKTALSLNDDQTAKVKVIYEAQAKTFDSMRTAAGENADRAALMAKRAPITAANNAKIKALLTPEQAATFQKQLDAQAERMKQRQQGN